MASSEGTEHEQTPDLVVLGDWALKVDRDLPEEAAENLVEVTSVCLAAWGKAFEQQMKVLGTEVQVRLG